ncbi:MAG TPA: cysteine peptidase family C39 domain-containing protein, partial [Polyangiaceae bacterium]|nr:cysteine peptidase family C39 domain-containing protein [Polyangiaceae bacterium]
MSSTPPRAWFVPEVIQTSAMDCGPAALKALLGGLGIPLNYAALRDACHTGADGTSIDALEDLCTALGLEAHQELAPLGDAIEILAASAPCIVTIKTSSGQPHFVVLWRRRAGLLEIMDPGRGRRWVGARAFVNELYLHFQPFDPPMFRSWFTGTEWYRVLKKRLAALGATSLLPDSLLDAPAIGAIDGGARLVTRLVADGTLRQPAAAAAVRNVVQAELGSADGILPDTMKASRHDEVAGFGVRGVVFLAVRRKEPTSPTQALPPLARKLMGADGPTPLEMLRSQLTSHGARLVHLLGIVTVSVVICAFAEMLLLRAAFNAHSWLALPYQRFTGTSLYVGVVLLLLALETLLGLGVARFSRGLELRTRVALLSKLPRLPDRYFRTRPMSDTAHRTLGLFQLKPMPELLAIGMRQGIDLLVTVVALCLVYPRGTPWAMLALAFVLGVPLLSLGAHTQAEHRTQAHAGALAQLYLDVLQGLSPIRTHGGQAAVGAKQDELLVDWRLESARTTRMLAWSEALQSAGVLAAISLLLASYLASGASGGLLVLAFWALRLPLHGRALAGTIQRLPTILASLTRLVEPLAAEEASATEGEPEPRSPSGGPAISSGMALSLQDVHVVLGGHEVLSNVGFRVEPGERVAIVGRSGAGKSSLFAALMGVVELEAGALRVDGAPGRL